MRFEQRNPLPIGARGDYARVRSTLETVFDWRYALEKKNLLALYEKGKLAAWKADDIDWSIEVDPPKILRRRVEAGSARVANEMLQPPVRFSDQAAVELQMHLDAFMLSQFLHGEQGALLAAAKLVQAMPWEEAKFYAANQAADEARHVEVYHRYLTEKLGESYEVIPSLATLLDQVVEDSRWDVTFLGMQIMVEGLALAAFGLLRVQMGDEPLIQDIIGRVMSDEARHVAFGVMALEDLYRGGLEAHEMREREDFVIEATQLLHDRLLMDQVFERLGWDVPLWSAWSQQTPYMRGFRQMMFSKIVPNLRRLGLLTPRVRAGLERLDLLHFAANKDSVEDPEIAPPAELVKYLLEFMQAVPPLGSGRSEP
jgi:hypothetical protein